MPASYLTPLKLEDRLEWRHKVGDLSLEITSKVARIKLVSLADCSCRRRRKGITRSAPLPKKLDQRGDAVNQQTEYPRGGTGEHCKVLVLGLAIPLLGGAVEPQELRS